MSDVLGLDATLRELREGLRLIELRLDQRDAAAQSTIQTLTRQMVQMEATLEGRLGVLEEQLTALNARGARLEGRLAHIETLLADIARKLDGLGVA
jgi:phage shock protein A